MATIQVRKNSKGTKSYRAMIRVKGQPHLYATFPTPLEAKRWAREKEAELRSTKYHFSLAHKKTLRDTITKYIDEILPRTPKSIPARTSQLNWWKEELGHLKLIDLTPFLISRCMRKLKSHKTHYKKERSQATVARYLAALSHVCSTAQKELGWINDNPVRKVVSPVVHNSRVRFLSTVERTRLLDSCKVSRCTFLTEIVVLAICTGMRKGEIQHMRWRDVHFSDNFILLNETKNGDRRRVTLVEPAFSFLKELKDKQPDQDSLVFPSFINPQKPFDFRRAFTNACRRAEIENFRFHDLRHCTASYLAMNGATPNEIAEVLGHKSLQMVKRYTHLSQSHIAGVVEKMNKSVFRNLSNSANDISGLKEPTA